ncbi:hypothetical protein D3C71_1444820 [compost metagenome]
MVGLELRDSAGRVLGKGVPIAHGDEDLGLVARRRVGQALRQSRRLFQGLGQQGRAPAHPGVVGLGRLLAPRGDQPRQRRAHDARQTDDGRVVEQVEQEGFDRVRPVRPAEIGQHHSDAAARTIVFGGLGH